MALQAFIEKNHKAIKISSKLQAKVERHYSMTQSLFAHYQLYQQLASPFIEYTRYVLDKGTENERAGLAAGIVSKLEILQSKFRFVKQT